MSEILIIDDEADIRELVSDILKDEGYNTIAKSSASEAVQYFESGEIPTLVIADIWLEGSTMDGIGILKYIKLHHPNIPVIMISGHGNIETAIQTIKLGAYDFVEKPFKGEKLVIMVNRAIEASNLVEENKKLKSNDGLSAELIGNSKAVQGLRSSALLSAPTNSRIVITGDAGSGKEILARFIHNNSKRNKKPFFAIQLSNFNSEQLDIELFGQETKNSKKLGILEKADQGTLYLEEISDMPISIQSKFLKFLQVGSFQRIGGDKDIKVDVRVIAASSKNLEAEIQKGNLNQSLYYRLNVVPLKIMPISQRKEDIKGITEYFLNQMSSNLGIPLKHFSQEGLSIMCAYDWPGNVRQISNVVEWIYIMTPQSSTEIKVDMLPQELLNSIHDKHKNLNPVNSDILSKELKKARELFEKEYLSAQLNRFSGNISRTANFIGMDRTALHRKIKSLSIKCPANNDSEAMDIEAV